MLPWGNLHQLLSTKNGLVGGRSTWWKLIFHADNMPERNTEQERGKTSVCQNMKYIISTVANFHFIFVCGISKGQTHQMDFICGSNVLAVSVSNQCKCASWENFNDLEKCVLRSEFYWIQEKSKLELLNQEKPKKYWLLAWLSFFLQIWFEIHRT